MTTVSIVTLNIWQQSAKWHSAYEIQHNNDQRNYETQHDNISHNDIQHNCKLLATLSMMAQHCYAECRLCWVSLMLRCLVSHISPYAKCHYAECRYAKCHYAECRYAKCHGAWKNRAASITAIGIMVLKDKCCLCLVSLLIPSMPLSLVSLCWGSFRPFISRFQGFNWRQKFLNNFSHI